MEYLEDLDTDIEDEDSFGEDGLDEDFDEEECEDSECGLPECAKTKKVSLTSLEGLKKHFDEVLLERTEFCNVLTLRDKANRTNYDWIVWLQVKIPFKNHNSHAGHSDEEYIEGVCKKILEWVDLLKNFDKSENKQLLLFDDSSDDELEPEPESPSGGSEGSWSKYHRELERVKKNNLRKRYTFFELCDVANSWYAYHDPCVVKSWIDKLPKNNKEMIELVKDAIVKGTTSEEGHGRFEEFWWDDSTKYMTRDGALSDFEIIARVKHLIRLYLVPYTRCFHVSTDNSYSFWELETKTDYRFWFDGGKIQGSSWLRSDELPEYELYDVEFIAWLREHFNIAHKEIISDEDVLRLTLEQLFARAFKEDDTSFDALEEIKKSKSFNEFKAKALSRAKLGNGGSGGYFKDGFSTDIDLFAGKKGHVIKIRQLAQLRIDLGRSIESMEVDNYWQRDVYVYKLTFAEALEKAYALFGPQKPKQLDLFHFLAA